MGAVLGMSAQQQARVLLSEGPEFSKMTLSEP
jgi:hypothetical protein